MTFETDGFGVPKKSGSCVELFSLKYLRNNFFADACFARIRAANYSDNVGSSGPISPFGSDSV